MSKYMDRFQKETGRKYFSIDDYVRWLEELLEELENARHN